MHEPMGPPLERAIGDPVSCVAHEQVAVGHCPHEKDSDEIELSRPRDWGAFFHTVLASALVRPTQPGVLPTYRHIIKVAAIADIGTPAITELE